MDAIQSKYNLGCGVNPPPSLIVTCDLAINNPGNIRTEPFSYIGKVSGPSTSFLSFDTLANGYLAMITKLRYYYEFYQDTTLSKLLDRYSPASDGNTPVAETLNICKNLNIQPTDDIKDILYSPAVIDLVDLITQHEQTHDTWVACDPILILSWYYLHSVLGFTAF